MFVYKFNKYTGKYYKYDTDDVDLFSPMFDEQLHPQDDEFEADYKLDPSFGMMCAFCQTEFETRSQLFKHLGYMGLNIRRATEESYSKYDIEKGEYGMVFKKDECNDNDANIDHQYMDIFRIRSSKKKMESDNLAEQFEKLNFGKVRKYSETINSDDNMEDSYSCKQKVMRIS